MIVAQKNPRAQKLSSTWRSYQYSWNSKERRSENSRSGLKDRLLTLCIHVLLNFQNSILYSKKQQNFHKLWKFDWSSAR